MTGDEMFSGLTSEQAKDMLTKLAELNVKKILRPEGKCIFCGSYEEIKVSLDISEDRSKVGFSCTQCCSEMGSMLDTVFDATESGLMDGSYQELIQ